MYSNTTILLDVTIEEQEIVVACSLVTEDVSENIMVAGVPAKLIRERKNFEKRKAELNHIWLHNGEFQE